MKKAFGVKLISMLLVIATLMAALPMSVFAQTLQGADKEVYMKSVKIAQARDRETAKSILEEQGYIFLDHNLNEGTGADGIWVGYITTTDPTEAIYDIKLMNTKGGYTLTSMKSALEARESTFAQMAEDLNNLVDEFVKAYHAGSVPAQKAYMALNFFRIEEKETTLSEQNGLGYQLVNGYMSVEKLTNMILFCDGAIFDSIVKLLAMGIQLTTANWMQELSKLGEYDEDYLYGNDEAELKRRAKQILVVLQLYAQTYNAMDSMGLVSGTFDEQGNIVTEGNKSDEITTAEQADMVKNDLGRLKSYKLIFDELAKYKYGNGTLKDFFCSLENETDETVLYPLVSILTDGEFAALSYGCFIEFALGANVNASDFDNYDETYAELTKEVKSFYLYTGVNSALLDDKTIIAFTDTASRHMALTGEYQFYEKESWGENAWETGRNIAICIGATGMAVMAASKLTLGVMSLIGVLSVATAEGATGVLAGLAKICALAGGGYTTLITFAIAAVVAIVTYVLYVIDEYKNNHVDWEANPIPEYIYDVQEVGYVGTSKNEGIEADYVRRSTYVFYEAVRDTKGNAADLNARDEDAKQWIAMYVSYDRPGDDSKPIKAKDFLVKTGDGKAPDGYTPVTRFEETIAYDLNQWDDKNTVNGIFMFYQQDKQIVMDSDRTYYIYDVHLQTGESTAHCLNLLEAAGYTPLNVNLTPDYAVEGLVSKTKTYTYLGYKVTTSSENAITDLRMEYGLTQAEVQLGGVTYANSGSSAGVTLYATKYKAAGTPLLEGGLKCVTDRNDAPAGYEPVNFLSGGPAMSFNTTPEGIQIWMEEYFLYFLPETTFTGGMNYLGGLAYYYCTDETGDEYYLKSVNSPYREPILSYLKSVTGVDYPVSTAEEIKCAMRDYMILRIEQSGYDISGSAFTVFSDQYSDSVFKYYTHNPYRAIYGVKGTALNNISSLLTYEGQGYASWTTILWNGKFHAQMGQVWDTIELCYNGQGAKTPLDMSASLFLSGNPSATNVYNAETGRMTEIQPLDSNGIAIGYNDESFLSLPCFTENDDGWLRVSETFHSSADCLVVKQNANNCKEYIFSYQGDKEKEKPYISSVTAVDSLSIFRASGGADAGLKRSDITNNMLLVQLSKQGATHFADITAAMHREAYFLQGMFGDSYKKMNITKFGYTRTDESSQALRDVFIYVAGFSDDEPPRQITRGKVKYTLLCELCGNLTGYEEAPQPGIYLYGTTDKSAGAPITDIQFSATPFMDSYETVRTQNGRSMWAEVTDYMKNQQSKHFMSGAKTLFEALAEFFGFKLDRDDEYYDNLRAEKYYYIHIQREGDDLRTQKPYISELYLADAVYDPYGKEGEKKLMYAAILDHLFDQGADAYLNLNLNKDIPGRYIYLGYRYTADPSEAITAIRCDHSSKTSKTSVTLNGDTYHLVRDLNLNAGNGGDTIYMYYTKSQSANAGTPITAIRYALNTPPTYSAVDTASVTPVMRLDNQNPSDLNAGIKSPIYLMVERPFEVKMGTYKEPNYGNDKTSSRKNTSGSEKGKYVAAVYVMDKNTIRQEKLAAGVASDQCTCAKITDQEVFDRLTKMGATTILKTPININGGEYGKNNQNKVFIGYSRTDDASKAIKDITIKAEVFSLGEPEATVYIGKTAYTLVAEAAAKVTKLPEAINLIGTEDGQSLLIPGLYLYTTTVGSTEPIHDICIDSNPLLNGWVTITSTSCIEPFRDLYQQAQKQAELGDKDDSDSYDSELVYTDELYKWMEDVSETFNPSKEKISAFYLHCKRYEGSSVNDALPYIGEIYIAAGNSKLDVLTKLIAYGPDGYIDCDLNKRAGGDYIYLAYKRTDNKSDAITNILSTATNLSGSTIAAQKIPEAINLISGNKAIRYYLASPINLNQGINRLNSYQIYLYYTKKADAGEPIKDIYISGSKVSKKVSGFYTETTILDAERTQVGSVDYKTTDRSSDLNLSVGGAYLYLVMKRDKPQSNFVASLITPGSVASIGILMAISAAVAFAVVYKKRKTQA